ncbi:MAG: glucosamine-6-phosphate deaminase [Bacteroidetes bacterium]|jgi:glucosamine-6-phosphate deaminase|nr:glucosamine-6-phosphate deaminase [Bacteroidota bacterium]
MKYDLSSEISLEMVPERYYRTADMLEGLRQRRFEKLRTNICKDQKEGSLFTARRIAALIREKERTDEPCVLGLSGGTSALGVYEELVRMHREENLNFSHVIVFNVSEFFPIHDDNRHSNGKLLRDWIISKVDIKPGNFITPDSSIHRTDVYEYCNKYEQLIAQYEGLDLVLLSVGLVGNIAYNEPGSQVSTLTRLILLDHESRRDLKRFYSSPSEVPDSAITIGLSTIQNAAEVILLAWGENKSQIVKEVIQGKVDDNVPASFLQLHKNATAVVDLGAAEHLTRISQPWLVGSCEWTNKLIRRAIVWLCSQTGKPILKLTNKDYNQHGLDELLSLYGSAYDVNIRIFNDLQHTITGWPGGKPDADDTNRPERALPYPKRVLVFSPHPDDDVISMGGTLQRLVDQSHDVHVAYQTSGNIAVGDEEIVQVLSLIKHLGESYGGNVSVLGQKCEEALAFLTNEKKTGDIDSPDVLSIKGQLRKEEARAACRYVGIKAENVHFLGLPFYETGRIQKNKLSDTDILKIIPLLEEIKPHQIYLAGDLADPHGTHKVCLDAALAAIYELRDEEWMKNCRIWMYRGAWAEWEIDHIEMAVPISPEELRRKRNSILKHQSQMESAPFLGNDERLFWQRSEDRNRATAELYKNLGLAAYEAIEAFVEYKKL